MLHLFSWMPKHNSALQLTKALLKANFSYNLQRQKREKREARDQISEEFLFIKRGTILVRQGDIITKENQGKLQQAFAKDSQSFNLIGGIFFSIDICRSGDF